MRSAAWAVVVLLVVALLAGIFLAWASEHCMCGEAVVWAPPYSPPLVHDRKPPDRRWS